MDPSSADLPLALIVEDELILAMAVEDLLTAEGFATIVVRSEAEARAHAAAEIAVAGVNLRLSATLAGQRIIRALRRRDPSLPVVVVTGYSAQAPQANLRGLGGPTIRLHKPAGYAELAEAVWDVIGQARAGAPPADGRRLSDPASP